MGEPGWRRRSCSWGGSLGETSGSSPARLCVLFQRQPASREHDSWRGLSGRGAALEAKEVAPMRPGSEWPTPHSPSSRTSPSSTCVDLVLLAFAVRESPANGGLSVAPPVSSSPGAERTSSTFDLRERGRPACAAPLSGRPPGGPLRVSDRQDVAVGVLEPRTRVVAELGNPFLVGVEGFAVLLEGHTLPRQLVHCRFDVSDPPPG